MKDLINNIFSAANERIKNPFVFAFIVGFISFNWRPISIYLFSSHTMEERIAAINTLYIDPYHNLLYPLLIVFIYLAILPYIMLGVDFIAGRSIIGRKIHFYKSREADLDGEIKLANKQVQLENLKADYRDKADLNNKIAELNKDLEDRDDTIRNYQEELTDREKTIKLLSRMSEQTKGAMKELWDLRSMQLSNDELVLMENSYEEFKKSTLFNHFLEVGTAIIQNENPELNHEVIQKYIAENIIKRSFHLDRESNQVSILDFTEKGRYFWHKYIQEET